MLPEMVRILTQPVEYPAASRSSPTLHFLSQKPASSRMIMCYSPDCKYVCVVSL